jgi:outer membrane protein assembly factor BamA
VLLKPLFANYSSKLRPGRWRSGYWGPLLALLALAGCSPFGLLRPGQRLLSRVELRGIAEADEERLTALAQQTPNTGFPLPKLAIYQLGHRFYDSVRIKNRLRTIRAGYDARLKAAGTDSAKLGKLLAQRERKVERKQLALDKGNAIMRLGEAPVVYDTALTRHSVEQMTTYLHSQGFFRARVTATDTCPLPTGPGAENAAGHRGHPARQARFAGRAQAAPPRHGSLRHPRKPAVCLPAAAPQHSRFGGGRRGARGPGGEPAPRNERYNEEAIGQERTRLEALLKNSGYYDFRQQYITLEADTSYEKFTVQLRTLIANPGPNQGHRLYTLRQVRFVTDAGVGRTLRSAVGDTLRRAGAPGLPRTRPRLGARPDTTVTDSVHFAAYNQKFSTRMLARKVMVRPGQRYSLDRTLQTQRLLADLDMFRFNAVNYRKVPDPPSADSTGVHPSTGELVAVINASPAPKFTETTEFGATFIADKTGPFINVRLKTRNPFGGAEVLELGLRAGLEGQLSRLATDSTGGPTSVYTRQLGATASLILPQFLVPFNANRFLSRYNPKTRFTLSETYVDRPEYTRSNFEFAFDYVWQRSAVHQYVFSPVVITLVNTLSTSQQFQQRLDTLRIKEGSALYRSFIRQIEPSFSFTSLYNSNDFNQTRDAHFMRLSAEIGGLTRGLYRNALFNRTGLNVYDFARLSADYRRYHRLTAKTYFVWRLNGGAVHALSRTSDQLTGLNPFIVPYDKSFFAGGSTSLRAWQPRRLGPGGYTSFLSSGRRDFITEQPGELLLEGSAEYRFPLYNFVKGAFFTDFGNVWGLQERRNEQGQYLRPGAQFQLNQFYRQIAVGSGFGIRFDFTFLILRLDIATRVYDPTAPASGKWALRNFNSRANPLSFNLGIGYPY